MPSSSEFYAGDRVKLSPKGFARMDRVRPWPRQDNPRTTGVVTKNATPYRIMMDRIVVKVDGTNSERPFQAVFWEKVN